MAKLTKYTTFDELKSSDKYTNADISKNKKEFENFIKLLKMKRKINIKRKQ